jgi:hypothetical protein
MSRLIEHIARRNEERQFFATIFKDAGFVHVAMDEVKNRYRNSLAAPPWFAVTTEMGFFVIGWRKRVIHIEWKDINLPGDHFDDLGVVTHGLDYVHAWDIKKAVEYLDRIRRHGTLTDPDSLDGPRAPGELEMLREVMHVTLHTMANDFINAEAARTKRDAECD